MTTVYARLAKNGDRVLCGRCPGRLGDVVSGPLVGMIAERGGPSLEDVQVGADERRLELLEGYSPPPEPSVVWRMGNHARKRLKRGEQPGFSHGDARNALAEYPAYVECWRCETVNTIDVRRFGFLDRGSGVLVAEPAL